MWMPSLDLATGLWARMRRTLYTLFSRLSRAAQRFWMSRAYFPVLLTVSAAFMAAGEPVSQYLLQRLGNTLHALAYGENVDSVHLVKIIHGRSASGVSRGFKILPVEDELAAFHMDELFGVVIWVRGFHTGFHYVRDQLASIYISV